MTTSTTTFSQHVACLYVLSLKINERIHFPLPSLLVCATSESPALHDWHCCRDGLSQLQRVSAQGLGCTQLHVSPSEGDIERKKDRGWRSRPPCSCMTVSLSSAISIQLWLVSEGSCFYFEWHNPRASGDTFYVGTKNKSNVTESAYADYAYYLFNVLTYFNQFF